MTTSLSVGVNDVIKRLQDVMAEDNDELKKVIGGAVDIETILNNTSIAPMSFHVAYVGASVPESFVNAETSARITKNFVVYVVINVEEFNGRYPQSLIPKIEEQLIYSLFTWEPTESHHPFLYGGDNVEYMDRGRYIHSFAFMSDYEFRIDSDEDGNTNIFQEGNPTPFDSLIATWNIGEDEEGNPTDIQQDILNIYNDGEPLV